MYLWNTFWHIFWVRFEKKVLIIFLRYFWHGFWNYFWHRFSEYFLALIFGIFFDIKFLIFFLAQNGIGFSNRFHGRIPWNYFGINWGVEMTLSLFELIRFGKSTLGTNPNTSLVHLCIFKYIFVHFKFI